MRTRELFDTIGPRRPKRATLSPYSHRRIAVRGGLSRSQVT